MAVDSAWFPGFFVFENAVARIDKQGKCGFKASPSLHNAELHCASILTTSTPYLSGNVLWELIFRKWIWTATFQFSKSSRSLNGPDLFTELPFL